MERTQSGKNVRKSNLLRGGLIVLAAVMLLCGTYLATLAYLHESTKDTVQNTFVPASFKNTTLTIVEKAHTADNLNNNGIYDEVGSGSPVTGETFKFAPGVTLKKQPYVVIENLPEYAYLFIKVEQSAMDMFEWQVDSDNWQPIVTGSNIYYYVGEDAVENTGGILAAGNYPKNNLSMDIIQGDQVYVKPGYYDNNNDLVEGAYVIGKTTAQDYANSQIVFSAYLVQATGFSTAKQAWDATYGK